MNDVHLHLKPILVISSRSLFPHSRAFPFRLTLLYQEKQKKKQLIVLDAVELTTFLRIERLKY